MIAVTATLSLNLPLRGLGGVFQSPKQMSINSLFLPRYAVAAKGAVIGAGGVNWTT
jgi:hypothetical protein